MESTLNKKCPFCNEPLKMSQYSMTGRMPSITVFCDNDHCDTGPCTVHTNPAAAFADVAAWGKY